MATVYLAHDVRHDRKVAIKVLKPELAAVLGAERFVVEIKTTAALSHPHILPLFDSGTADGFLYYVMPYIKGETIREKLNRETQFGVDEAVRIAREVADALDYAHRHGVIHRDIKPENILLHDGRPMVMDFGIALAVSAAAGGRMTETGLSLGTPHYMSPEQATADKEITGRSDVYSLASVLYEMLAGVPPHEGGSAQQVIMRIIADTPRPVSDLRKSVPPNVAAAIEMALEKLPADRFQSARDFATALANPAFVAGRTHALRTQPVMRDWRQRWAAPLLALAVIATSLGAVGWLRSPGKEGRMRQLVVNVPRLSRTEFPVLSPTGDRMVFIGDGRLWIRGLDNLSSQPLAGTEEAHAPFWSPDGRHIGYFVGNRVFRIPAEGGAPALVTSLSFACPAHQICGGTWTDDGRMMLSSGFEDVYVVSDRGGQAQLYLKAAEGEHFHSVTALPGGRGIIVDVDPDHGSPRIDIWDGSTRRRLLEPATFPRYAEAGYLLFLRGGGVWAVRLDGTTLAGDPFPVVDRAGSPSVARDGSLLFFSSGAYESDLIWVDRNGAMREEVGSDDGSARNPALSADETRIAFDGKAGIRIHHPARGLRMALGGADTASQNGPVWSPDGEQLYYESTRPGVTDTEDVLIRAMTLGARAARVVVDSGFDPHISRDGRYFTYSAGNVSTQDLWYRDLRGSDTSAKPFLVSPEYTSSLRLTADSRYATFLAGDWKTGKFEVYLSRFPGGEERTQVSNGGLRFSSRVYWSIAGDQIYYERSADGALMAADVTLGTQVSLSAPRVLFTESATDVSLGAGIAVSRDASKFLVVRRRVRPGGEPAAFVLLGNWTGLAPKAARP